MRNALVGPSLARSALVTAPNEGSGSPPRTFEFACRGNDGVAPAPFSSAQARAHELAHSGKAGAVSSLGPVHKSPIAIRPRKSRTVEVTAQALSTQPIRRNDRNKIKGWIEGVWPPPSLHKR